MGPGRAASTSAGTGSRNTDVRTSRDLAPAPSRSNSSPNISSPAASAIISATASGSSVGSVRGSGCPVLALIAASMRPATSG